MFLAKSYCDIGNYSAGYMAGISGQGWGKLLVRHLMHWNLYKCADFLQRLWFLRPPRKQALIEGTKNTGNNSMKFKECYKKDESILGM